MFCQENDLLINVAYFWAGSLSVSLFLVREVVMCLRRQYGVEHVYGIPEGYRGFLDPSIWRPQDEATVANYHNMGGSVLGSSRGGHDTKAIVDSLVSQNINLLFVVGGDGTLRGAAKISDEAQRRGLKISVASIPKTIDNDIPLSTSSLVAVLMFAMFLNGLVL